MPDFLPSFTIKFWISNILQSHRPSTVDCRSILRQRHWCSRLVNPSSFGRRIPPNAVHSGHCAWIHASTNSRLQYCPMCTRLHLKGTTVFPSRTLFHFYVPPRSTSIISLCGTVLFSAICSESLLLSLYRLYIISMIIDFILVPWDSSRGERENCVSCGGFCCEPQNCSLAMDPLVYWSIALLVLCLSTAFSFVRTSFSSISILFLTENRKISYVRIGFGRVVLLVIY